MPSEDPHAVLGLPRSASPADVKAAYRRLAKEHHPDKGGDPANFKRVTAAYETLQDPNYRVESSFDQLEDLFDQFFAGMPKTPPRPRAPRPPRTQRAHVRASDGSTLRVEGRDVLSELRLSFVAAILGGPQSVPCISGSAEVKVPSGTSSGAKLRLRGKGLDGGDHIVTIMIDVPRLSADQLERFRAAVGDLAGPATAATATAAPAVDA